jgi:hypothetical protein
MNFKSFCHRQINEESSLRIIGKGQHFVTLVDDSDEDMEGTVIKEPINGGKISSLELKKHQFMKDQENTGAFVKIFDVSSDLIWAERADMETGYRMCWDFAETYLDLSGDEEYEDDDMKSDFILKALDPFKSVVDWEWVGRLVDDYPSDPDIVSSKYLFDLRERIKSVKSWPVKVFDIHAENIGMVYRDGIERLVITDF